MSFQFILSSLYFFLPAYFVNMTPPLIKKAGVFKFLDRPVDFEKKFHGEPFFGNHKTWRGVIFGILAGFLVVLIQSRLYQFSAIQNISFLNYYQINIFLFGFLISGGAIFGDLFFAFIKRRINLKPGQRFLPFDQTNYIIGSFIFLQPVLKLDCSVWITLFILTFFLHIIFNRIGFLLGLHKNRW